MRARLGASVLTAVLAGSVLAGCGDDPPEFDSGGSGGGSTGGEALEPGDELPVERTTSPLAAGTLQLTGSGSVVTTCGTQVCAWALGDDRASRPEVVGAGGEVLAYPAGIALEPAGDAVAVVDVAGREVRAVLEGHGSGDDALPAVRAVAADPEGRRAVTAGEDGTVRVWDLAAGEETARLDVPEVLASTPVLDAEAGTVALTWSEGSAEDPSRGSGVFELADGSLVAEPAGLARALAWSPDGSSLVGTDADGDLAVWSADDWDAPESSGVPSVGPAAVSPDGRTVAFVDTDDPTTLHLWEPGSGQEPRTVVTDHPDPVVSLAFSADGARLASASSQVVAEDEAPPERPRDEVQVRDLGGGGDVVRLLPPDGDPGSGSGSP